MSRSTILRTTWNSRVTTWHDHVGSSPAFENVRDRVVDAAQLSGSERIVDLGAGTGFLSLALAPNAAEVLATDLSDEMLRALDADARAAGLTNVRTQQDDLTTFDLPASSVDLVVSNYALHHLVDDEKRKLVARMYTWLRPGGRVVLADMMFGRGRTARDRKVIRQKVVALVRKGPGGVWRVAKNLVRFGLARGSELPASPELWVAAFEDAGFHEVRFEPIVAEAGLVTAIRPAHLPPDQEEQAVPSG